ncbi:MULTISPECIES: sulfotransferase domain-containing protein [Falsihalocynthiibacter]|uniref:sulfotransferase domain-containing protein n=1 Tax=Falsihalocynthiibacter TaxID=2854182 RepID=UPI003001095A
MRDQFPSPSQVYNSDVSNSDIWSRFDNRPDDVFVCTPPKSGTTWMQSICGMLIFGDPEVNPGIGTISKWLDSKFNDEKELMDTLKAQTHRRYIKTHTPLDGITYDKNCTYLSVHRHPIDVVFSAQNHIKNMANGTLDKFIADDINEGFRTFVETPFSPLQNGGESLEGLALHFKSFHNGHACANIHMFHYADMVRDLRGAVSNLSEILECNDDDDLIDAIVEAATFSSMKKNADKFAPSANRGIWKDNAQFFESGTSNKWEGILSAENLSLYDAKMKEFLTPKERAWFEFGSKG